MDTIFARIVSSPTFLAFMINIPFLFSVPPVTNSPMVFSTGMASPVIILSSTEDCPSVMMPSTGMASPGRTRSTSPSIIFSSGASYSSPFSNTRRAVFGDKSRSALIASPVRSRARNSKTCPTKTSAMMTTDASK